MWLSIYCHEAWRYFAGKLRTADCIAKGRVDVVVMSKRDFQDLDNPLLAWMIDYDAVATVLKVKFYSFKQGNPLGPTSGAAPPRKALLSAGALSLASLLTSIILKALVCQ